MGQHKTNPNCKLAAEGKLEPKKKPMSKKELNMCIHAALVARDPVLFNVLGGVQSLKY